MRSAVAVALMQVSDFFCYVQRSSDPQCFWMGRTFPPPITILLDVDFYLTHGSFGPPESPTQTASRSVQPFLQGPRTWPTDLYRHTDKQTDHATLSVAIGRIAAMRHKNSVVRLTSCSGQLNASSRRSAITVFVTDLLQTRAKYDANPSRRNCEWSSQGLPRRWDGLHRMDSWSKDAFVFHTFDRWREPDKSISNEPMIVFVAESKNMHRHHDHSYVLQRHRYQYAWNKVSP